MPVSQISCVLWFRDLTQKSLIPRVQVDGYLARRYNMGSVLGSILDPAADKALMTTLVVTLTVGGLIPCASAYIPSLRPPSDPFVPLTIQYRLALSSWGEMCC